MHEHLDIWKDIYAIKSYEIDPEMKASLTSLCNFFQESAWHHARKHHYGYHDLLKRNLGWMLSRFMVRIMKFPSWGERVTVETWAKGVDRFFALRDFQILDDRDNIIGVATSAWLLLELGSYRPVRLETFRNEFPFIPSKHAIEASLKKLPDLMKADNENQIIVKYSDLDINNHVNNVKYIEWILDSFPVEIRKTFRMETLEINFLAEALLGERILIQSGETGEVKSCTRAWVHRALRTSDRREIFRAKTRWLAN
ncbi:MAG: acyl-ACP thioesterase [Spirochaetes bacterium]|nr:MAG: acyl-ACP thioesterase [Spirochaetota bacterium]